MPKSSTRKKTPEQIIAGAKRAERDVTICLRADISYQIEQLEAELEELQQRPKDDTRLVSGVSEDEVALATQIQALEHEADENSLDLKLRAVPSWKWKQARINNPPNEWDKEQGWAIDRDDTCREVLAESVVSPELDDDTLLGMVAELSEGQWAKIRDDIMMVNGGDGSRPFSRHASLILRMSRSAAGSPEPTVSASNGSTDGSPPPSPPSSSGGTDNRLGGSQK